MTGIQKFVGSIEGYLGKLELHIKNKFPFDITIRTPLKKKFAVKFKGCDGKLSKCSVDSTISVPLPTIEKIFEDKAKMNF